MDNLNLYKGKNRTQTYSLQVAKAEAAKPEHIPKLMYFQKEKKEVLRSKSMKIMTKPIYTQTNRTN
jgi:hypothetical protein